MEKPNSMSWIVAVIALLLGLGAGYYYGNLKGVQKGVAQELAAADAKKKAAAEEATKAVNPFEQNTANPFGKAPTNPFDKVQVNPFQ